MRLVYFFVIDSVLVMAVASLVHCGARAGHAAYISEFMLQCKRSAETWLLPWLCAVAFAALVFVQLGWMYWVAVEWRARAAGAVRMTPRGAAEFLCPAATAVVGFLLVVVFPWRDASAAEVWAHRVGVVLLASGSFLSLQLIWWTLRLGDSAVVLRGGRAPGVPWLSWVECDIVFLVVLAVFMVTTVVRGVPVLSALCEYAAFGLLLVQTTWLLVLCWERDQAYAQGEEADVEDEEGHTGALLWSLLIAYGVEASVVLSLVW